MIKSNIHINIIIFNNFGLIQYQIFYIIIYINRVLTTYIINIRLYYYIRTNRMISKCITCVTP